MEIPSNSYHENQKILRSSLCLLIGWAFYWTVSADKVYAFEIYNKRSQVIAEESKIAYIIWKDWISNKGLAMSISCNKLWKLLIDKDLSTSYLRKATNIAPNTMTKLRKHEDDFLTVLCRICEALDADIGDVMEFTLEREGVD